MEDPMNKKLPYDKRYMLSSVNHTLKILEILMVRDHIDLNEITKLSGFNKTSVFKMLYTLEYRGFVKKLPNSKYCLGNKLHTFASTASNRQNLLDIAKPYITNLWANTQQSLTLCTLNSTGRVVFLAVKVEKNQDVVTGRTGADIECYTNSAGKVLLANAHQDIQDAILNSLQLQSITPNTITDIITLKEQLNEYRGKSIVMCMEESLIGYGDIASPIYDENGNCVACLNLVFNKNIEEEKLHFYMQQLFNATKNISTKMGFHSL